MFEIIRKITEEITYKRIITITENNFVFNYLDYLLLEIKHPEITTKKAMLPFFDSTPFFSLTVRLSHLPPWLEVGSYAEKYDISRKKTDDALLVTIKNKVCKE